MSFGVSTNVGVSGSGNYGGGVGGDVDVNVGGRGNYGGRVEIGGGYGNSGSVGVGVGGGYGNSGSVGVGIGGGYGNSGSVGVGISGGSGIGVSSGVGVSSNVGLGVSSNIKVATPTIGVGISGGSSSVGISGGVSSNMGGGISINAPTTKVTISSPKVEVHTPSVGLGVSVSGGVDIEATNTNEMLTESLRIHSVCAVCTLCKGVAHTTIDPSWNIINCLFAYFCTEFWLCYMCYKRKNMSCYNARHCCGACGKYIDTYTSC